MAADAARVQARRPSRIARSESCRPHPPARNAAASRASFRAQRLEIVIDTSPVTPDGRYIVVRGRLWRRANPALPEDERQRLVSRLMAARRAVALALKAADAAALSAARADVDAAKVALGERGPVWWDGDEDLNRRLARNTRYADWYERLKVDA